MDNNLKWIVGIIVTLSLGAGGAIYEYGRTKHFSETFISENFVLPIHIPVTLSKSGQIKVRAIATVITHNPDYGKEGWKLGSGVEVIVKIEGETTKNCTKSNVLKEVIKDGQKTLRITVDCTVDNISKGGYFIEIFGSFVGNCKVLPHVPSTCNKTALIGSYIVTEPGWF